MSLRKKMSPEDAWAVPLAEVFVSAKRKLEYGEKVYAICDRCLGRVYADDIWRAHNSNRDLCWNCHIRICCSEPNLLREGNTHES